MIAERLQSVLHMVYPPRCLNCGGMVDSDFGLCGPCFAGMHFIGGLTCETCGTPLPGEAGGAAEHCDDCLASARPWTMGRAALVYRETGRRLVLALKHGDRQDIVPAASLWMARAARPLVLPDMLVLPVPLHWTRRLSRRFNQSALLARALARHLGLDYRPELARRARRTPVLDGLGRDARHETLSGVFAADPRLAGQLGARPVLLVDDVMTSGATLAALADTLAGAGYGEIRVVTLARVAKDT